ncbi:TetR/AcrR family transcriptional regulator [Tsukamurella sp. 8F]|uniref:TetR/AcrR family transcriptional regulator n=1 Tax=unclassified Tsukamurella TaxID=2633480 RepID=UPI0023B8FAC2|nr:MULTISPECIES: TetR/AcrR family transcriptional regulator [unclassified Tsukamurella]MDF0530064.1 TetR/AcrR family transcriptional regulator [Tsukamurella sp. 8J]MDF0586382.1 TetR/AcrR family transcriptional regulator [Tsukamurella sp. 8F]
MPQRSPGRPRSDEVRRTILAAATALVIEGGYGAATMQAIARRAGASKQTVYRWWPSPGAIVLEALVDGAAVIAPPEESGDLEHDMPAFVRRTVLGVRGKVARLLAAVMAEAQRDPVFASTLREGFLAHRRNMLAAMLAAARDRGEIRGDVDVALVSEVVFGTLWYRLLAASGPIDESFADDMIGVVWALVR